MRERLRRARWKVREHAWDGLAHIGSALGWDWLMWRGIDGLMRLRWEVEAMEVSDA